MKKSLIQESSNNAVNILTDARHGWRKNARQTDVVCLGNKNKKVVAYDVVTSVDDAYAQRHELLGTKRIYEKLDQQGVVVSIHAHDNNASISKYVREQRPTTINQLDNWHALKQLEKSLKAIADGPKKKLGVTWHGELIDKPHPIRTHAYYALKNCDGNPATLRSILLNSVEHYKGNHASCSDQSRCRTDPNYQSRRRVITDPAAEKLLLDAIKKSVIFQKSKLFVHNMSTAHVESFNNSLNVLYNKRISFGNDTYKMKTAMAVGFWNEGKEQFSKTIWSAHVASLGQ